MAASFRILMGYRFQPTDKELSHLTHRSLRNKNCDDYEDLQIVNGNATAIGKNSLALGDEIDVRTFGVEDRHTALDDFVYKDTNEAFVPNQNEPSHQPPPLGQSFSHLPFLATTSEVHPVSISQKKRTRTNNEWNSSSSETNITVGVMERISLCIDSIAVDFQRVHSLLEKHKKLERKVRWRKGKKRDKTIYGMLSKRLQI
ncbi:hypothetical protein Ddye_014180 [Dipteronia dyeriana]|uniref:Uncharacterized protein n=1 Tax=Dipteronia dyeriana TaxID=168575 RepID=A0AAE0CKC8_9ROSI|nr:hypothetical protein Ddye_014180 [Dipteronia dyeriana]